MPLNPTVNSHRVEMCLLAILVTCNLLSMFQHGHVLLDPITTLFSSLLHILYSFQVDNNLLQK